LNVCGFFHSPDERSAPGIVLSEDLVVTDPDESLRVLGGCIGFLSILAFRKSLIADSLQAGHYLSKIGTSYLESYVFLDALFEGRGILVTPQAMVAMRAENCAPWNYFRVFVTEVHSMMVYAEQLGYARKVTRGIEAENLVRVRHFVSRVKIYGRGEEYWRSPQDAIRRLFGVYRFHPYVWFVVVPLMFFPRSLRPLVFRLRRLLGRPDAQSAQRATDLEMITISD
jgi:hypothetical protein